MEATLVAITGATMEVISAGTTAVTMAATQAPRNQKLLHPATRRGLATVSMLRTLSGIPAVLSTMEGLRLVTPSTPCCQ